MTQSLGTMSDRALWERACRGEEDAWTALRDRFGPAVTALLMGRTEPGSVSAVVDEVYGRAKGELRAIPNPSAVGAWLLDRARGHRMGGRGRATGEAGRLLGQMGRLDDDAREAILLEAAAGLDARGIADLLDVRLSEIEARLERGHGLLEPAALAKALAPYRYKAAPKRRNYKPLILTALVLALGVAAFLIVTNLPEKTEGWRVAWVSGAKGPDYLSVGGRIETTDDQRARLAVGDFGHIDIAPSSIVRRDPAEDQIESLHLDRGALQVKVAMPAPRRLSVRAPTARIVASRPDFVIECDADGRGVVTVHEGHVAVGTDGKRDVVVPKGASCRLLAEGGPGVPFFADGPDALKNVAPNDALSAALVASTARDTLTLWYLLPRVQGAERELIIAKIAELVPPPEDVTTDAAAKLDPQALAAWARVLKTHW